ncbi:MAG: polysaccharide pyruvyl transferase family protein [bacterium]|nr:polysaccharide pyruvyl transferase family protein [bacterium]
MKKVCVLGNFSGRNAGDAAILGGLLEDVSAVSRDLRYLVPTIKPSFVSRTFARFPVEPVSLMPWRLSLKIFGLPVLAATLGADLVLVTDAILFDRGLFNPLHNYLLTLSLVLPLARRRGVPVVLYNMSLGPVRTPRGERCLRRILDCADLVITRDTESLDLARRLGVPPERLREGADCALNVVPSGAARLEEIRRREGILSGGRPAVGFNVNAYIDAFVRAEGARLDRGDFLRVMAAVIDRAVGAFGAEAVLVITQPMDLGIAAELLGRLRERGRVRLVSNRDWSHADLAAVLSRLEIFTGMRTHSLILATAVGTPVAGIAAYPKNRGYLRSIGMGGQLIELADFTEENLWRLVERTWRERAALRERLVPAVEREKAKARRSAALLRPYLA